jgi:signal transduction histidine kinase/DNA-binding XRE family transcriptional regulator
MTTELAVRIRALRKIRKLTQAELARHLGVSQGIMSRWESGKHMPPSDILAKLAEFAGVSVSEFHYGPSAEEAIKKRRVQAIPAHSEPVDTIEITQGFALYNVDDRLVLFDGPYPDLLYPGMEPHVEVGMTFEDIVRHAVARGLVKNVEGDAEAWIAACVTRHRNPDGEQIQHRDSGQWVQTIERKTDEGGIVAIYTDVTNLKSAEHKRQLANQLIDTQRRDLDELAQNLVRANDQADNANRAETEFLVNMSHELRTHLNAIIGFSNMMTMEMFGPIGDQKYVEYAQDINMSGELLLKLIQDVLDLSKIEAGETRLHEANVDVLLILQSCLTLVKDQAAAVGVKIVFDIDSNLPALYADESKFEQILINLLSNAIKFTPSGGKVTITNWSHSDDGYGFQVTDTGVGISAEDIPKALNPFQQIDSGLNRKYEGAGLGLPLAKSLVELHGGSLDLQSEVGIGTTVTACFPATRIVSEAVRAVE